MTTIQGRKQQTDATLKNWNVLHAALDAEDSSKSSRVYERDDNRHPDLGDIAYCVQGTRLRYIFYEFLESRKYVLNDEERYHFQEIQKLMDREEHSRPCVVLAHHGPGSYVVCFLTTVQGQDLSDKAKLSPLVNHLSIPVEQAHKHGLRAEPSLMPPSLLIALPVVRSNLRVSIRLGTRQRLEIRQRLAYGELERARTLVRAKVAEFKNNHEIIRKKELATIWDRSHASNQGLTGSAPTSTTRPKIPREETPKFHPEPLQKFTFLTPPAMGHNVSWIVKHARTDIASASRYLSSLPHPPASPFRLPSPFYSPLLRASLAFVRRRIIP